VSLRRAALALVLAFLAATADAGTKRVLIYGKTFGFRHGGAIQKGSPILKTIAEKLGYEAVISEDPAVFDPDAVKQWDVIIFNNCTGRLNPAEEERRTALMQRIKDGAGFMGFHAAADCNYQWSEYGKMLNGYFSGHPWNQEVRTTIEDPDHPLMKPFGKGPFVIKDEIYQFRNYTRSDVRILMSINTRSVPVERGKRQDRDYAICWIRPWEKGRVYYNAHGHGNNVFENETFQKHVALAMQWAAGDLEVETTPSPEIDFKALAEEALESLKSATEDEAILEALDVLSYCPHPDALGAAESLFGRNQMVAAAASATVRSIVSDDKEMPKERKVELLKKALPAARDRRARHAIRQDLEKLGVKDLPLNNPPGFIARWWIGGPLRNRKDEMFDAMYPPETAVDLKAGFEAGGRKYKWRPVAVYEEGVLDLKLAINGGNNSGVYAYAEVTLDDLVDGELRLGTDESYVAWVNGKQVGSHKGGRKFQPGQDRLEFSLDEGVNRILVKSLQGGGDWLLSVQLVDDDGQPLKFSQKSE
jgi:type 1 glutamine amidotransferase